MRREESLDSRGRPVVKEYPEDDGPWSTIVRGPESTVYLPKATHRRPRVERRTPGGRVLVDDLAEGWVLWRAVHRVFDAAAKEAGDPALGENEERRRTEAGERLWVLTYQERYDDGDVLQSRRLHLVEEMQGATRLALEELDLDRTPPLKR